MNWEGYWTHQYKCLYNKGDCLEIVLLVVQYNFILYTIYHAIYIEINFLATYQSTDLSV